MSFRFSNELAGVLRQRVLLDRSRRQLVLRTFEGRADGIAVTYSAYGQVKSIRVADDSARKRFEDDKGVVRDPNALAAAIKAAVYDAQQQLLRAKEEAYRQSFSNNEELQKNASFHAYWFAQEGATLAPLPYEALKDSALVVNEAVAQGLSKERAEQLAFVAPTAAAGRPDAAAAAATALPSAIGAGAAGGVVGTSRNVTGVAATHRAYTPALLFLDDASLPSEFDRVRNGAIRFTAAAARYQNADAERYFWRRVEMMRRAQINVIGSELKRGYARNTQTPTEIHAASTQTAPFLEKVKVNFVS